MLILDENEMIYRPIETQFVIFLEYEKPFIFFHFVLLYFIPIPWSSGHSLGDKIK